MNRIVFNITDDAMVYVEGISLLARRYIREIMPNKKQGSMNAVIFELNGETSVNEVILTKIYHESNSVIVHSSIAGKEKVEEKEDIEVGDSPEDQAKHFGTRDIRG